MTLTGVVRWLQGGCWAATQRAATLPALITPPIFVNRIGRRLPPAAAIVSRQGGSRAYAPAYTDLPIDSIGTPAYKGTDGWRSMKTRA